MDLRERIDAHKDIILDHLDPDFGLLDELLASRSLTRSEVAKVKAVSDSYGRSEKLLEYVSHKSIYEKLLDALKNTQQTHLVNFISSNGVRRTDFGDDWPLTEREISILDTNQRSLVDLLETSDLLDHLYSHKVVNNRQRDFVSSKATSHERNDALLAILRRISLEDYKTTIDCLHLSNQSHIADIFKEGGAVIRVRSELETESDVSEVEDQLITKITEMLGDHSLGDSARILECAQLRLIAAKKGNSIILYFFCKTLTEVDNLEEMQSSGKLANIVREMFNEILSKAEVISLRITLYDEDVSKCNLGFHSLMSVENDREKQNIMLQLEDTDKAKMADTADDAEKQLMEITQCPICMSEFNDPRMLPCIHTFCFECMKRVAETKQMKPGDKMPCPLCRKEFTIPPEGIDRLQKNFFMENLLDFKTALNRNLPDLKSVSDVEEEIKQPRSTAADQICIKHAQKQLDFYCADCKEIVCVSCCVESHKLHDCKHVSSVDEEFRETIEKRSWKILNYADEILAMRKNTEQKKSNFLRIIEQKENAIHERSQELKDTIDRHTKSLLDELSAIKSKHLKEMENLMEEIERSSTILRSFETYCNELRSKVSASDICSSVNALTVIADELEKDHGKFIGRPRESVEVSFQPTDFDDALQKFNNNFVGYVEAKTDSSTHFEQCAAVIGLNDALSITNDVFKINLHRPNEISALHQVTSKMQKEATAAVFCNTMYITGIGAIGDEIWKYNMVSGWVKCGSLVQGRRRHCAAFIDEVLYICGGIAYFDESVLDSVEAYNAVTNNCKTVGKLFHSVHSSGNCVPFGNLLYIFGGKDKWSCSTPSKSLLNIFGGSDKANNAYGHVQMYNTKENTCTLLSKPMPRSCYLMRAALWEGSVILLGCDTCFIFNFETETWQERKQFKTDVVHFGLILDNERLFVIGGGDSETYKDGIVIWKCRDDVRSVSPWSIMENKSIEWKIHGRMPKPCLVQAFAKLRFLV